MSEIGIVLLSVPPMFLGYGRFNGDESFPSLATIRGTDDAGNTEPGFLVAAPTRRCRPGTVLIRRTGQAKTATGGKSSVAS